MALRLHNTLTRGLEPLEPLHPPRVGMYVCGPTVYDDPHLGHARSAFVFDVLRRYLAYRGYDVTFVRNVTDVDDKIIEKARQEVGAGDRGRGAGDLKATCGEVAQQYLKSYHAMLGRLGLEAPTHEPLATQHVVPDMTDFIAKLLIQGVAYEAGGAACRAAECHALHGTGRDVYFSVRKLEGYGALSHRSVDELQAGVRVEPGEHKQDPLDFALWKAAKPEEPSWPSPWGAGRPGWHIECSVMSTKYLGDAFDIHGGGVDLVFPHHENEVAQARGLGKGFARLWIHNGLLTVGGEKMSKSLGNFITVEQALAEAGGDVAALKVFFLGTHYRSPIDYTPGRLHAARRRLGAWQTFLEQTPPTPGAAAAAPAAETPSARRLEDEFTAAMDDDLNTAGALAALDRLVAAGHQTAPQAPERLAIAARLRALGEVLGLSFEEAVGLTSEQQEQLTQRERARQRRDFAAADRIRRQFDTQGLVIEDTAEGPLVRRKR
jgi:cysteinyl-tRNA synthetase